MKGGAVEDNVGGQVDLGRQADRLLVEQVLHELHALRAEAAQPERLVGGQLELVRLQLDPVEKVGDHL